ncbi:MAG TPA: hypothetical protein VMR62_31780 [Bryobacteraceae bacterium]|jgi:hypothetical protein|nr:hypothetical protein [Bryobacteraceae bacterium]
MEDPLDLELIANRFYRLVKELLQGEVRRTSFQRWEVDLLLDLQACRLTRSRRDEALRRYQRAVQKQLDRREFPPVRFADFLGRRKRQMAAMPPPLPGQDAASLNP